MIFVLYIYISDNFIIITYYSLFIKSILLNIYTTFYELFYVCIHSPSFLY